jgi:uncharacterized membrane protein
MEEQAPSEIGLIIMGIILVWIGVTILGVHATNSLVSSFDEYVGGGFIVAGAISLAGGAASVYASLKGR